MASVLPINPTPRRGLQRASHLRQVSNGSGGSEGASRPMSATSNATTVQHDPVKPSFERKCTLWVHEEAFSTDEVVFDLDLFPDVKPGELLGLVACPVPSGQPGVRDFQDKSQTSRHDTELLPGLMQRQRSNSNSDSLGTGSGTGRESDNAKQYLFMAQSMSKEMKKKNPSLEISVCKHVADVFGLKHRSHVFISTVDAAACSASHVELTFRDEYLSRSDMWRLALGELSNRAVYRGQKILFLGTIKAQVSSIYVDGQKLQSAYFSTVTKPVFRSESARFILFIQMSREMWDFDSEGSGEIMFNKVVNGFLPALFKKWASLKAKHLVSIVLFTRVEYNTGVASELASSTHDVAYHTGIQADGSKKPYKDFYRVVVSEMASGSWTTILYQLKREFKFFRRDVSLYHFDVASSLKRPDPTTGGTLGTRIGAEPSLAVHGNVLEAINLASSQFANDYIDRDLMRTGISVVVISPSPGLFEVDYETLRMTTENLTSNGIGIDLVCLPKMPLHSAPLFRYRNPEYKAFQEEAVQIKNLPSEDSTPKQIALMYGSSFSSLNGALSPSRGLVQDRSLRTGPFNVANPPREWSYAIPHWIDVSYWTGASQDIGLGNPAPLAIDKHLKGEQSLPAQKFPVRCKMYEMQMASVMENVLTEISVTPLQYNLLFSQMIVGHREIPDANQDPKDALETIPREKILSSLVEFVNGPSKSQVDRNSSNAEKAMFNAILEFDAATSEIVEDCLEGKRLPRGNNEEAVRKLDAEDAKVFGTSFKDLSTPKGPILMENSISKRSDDTPTNTEERAKSRKGSVSTSITPKPKAPSLRPPKFARQISLGKHGFGIAASGAAIAEIQTEHASAPRPNTSVSNHLEPTMSTTSAMASHLLGSTSNYRSERPASSQSEQYKNPHIPTPDLQSESEEAEKPQGSRPMTIKSALQSLDSTNQFKSRSMLGSLFEAPDGRGDAEGDGKPQTIRIDDAQKLYTSKLLAGSVPELPATLSPTTALSPWLKVVNPSNPSANAASGPSEYRRWQHIFPRPVRAKTMKWKSLCSPASVPLTTEYFPTKHQLDTEYQHKPYNLSQNAEEELNEVPRSREELLRELIGLRLSQGFQIVIGSAVANAFGQRPPRFANVFDRDHIAEDGTSVFMSMGNIIHQLSCVNESEIEVNMFVRKPTASTAASTGLVLPAVYNPAIRTTLLETYESRQVVLGKPRDEYNWNYVDAFIAGFDDEMSENLRFWRARFVLIPVERPAQPQQRHGEDNEEEIRLEGIRKLTQTWQRHRVFSLSERLPSKAARRDQNPLDIVYRTEDPSVVVTTELDTLPLIDTNMSNLNHGQWKVKERFRSTDFDVGILAEAIQAPVEHGGVQIRNRFWKNRLHFNSFIGSDLTTWFIENFEDIDTREEAVKLGNSLMMKDELHKIKENEISKEGKRETRNFGLFAHVEKRHQFRDGNYFYRITGDYVHRSGWLAGLTGARRDTSVPSTPMTENLSREPPRPDRSRSGSNHDDKLTDSGTSTPTLGASAGGKKPKVALSKVIKYDVDHRRRSYRPERINLHYDRLHNPDNCYHIRIDWMGVTAKLIEDAVESWARTTESYGLRLVEVPIGEVCTITLVHPFRSPYTIELALQPPTEQPKTFYDANSFDPQAQPTSAKQHFYQKAILKKFNFVLDIEAARNFPSNVEVTYSWGKPDFKYTQYIHRTGILLAQITDEGNFLLLANRLYNNRTGGAREPDRYGKLDYDRNTRQGPIAYNHGTREDKSSPVTSPALRPTTSITSPALRATTTTTTDVLGQMLPISKIATITTPETIKNEMEPFCRSATALEAFYKEVYEKATPPSATPPTSAFRSPFGGSLLDSNIPTLGLPPGVLARDTSPSPSVLRLSNLSSIGSPRPQPGRRSSVQVGVSAEGPKQESSRGSMHESDKGT